MNQSLQVAIDNLEIADVYIKSSAFYVKDGVEPKFDLSGEDVIIQSKHVVKRAEKIQVFNNNDESELILRVFIDVGIRWVFSSEEELDEQTEALAEIGAVFVAEYFMNSDLGQEAIDAFSLNNASYHVWPYWREYLMNTCGRMNLPKIALPAMQLAQNRYQGSDLES